MKQKMKRAISFIALMAMLVSMFAVFVIPASAEKSEYDTFLAEAYVVNPSWSNKVNGDPISFTYRGKAVTMAGHTVFDRTVHFASFEDAYEQAKKDGVKIPVILLTAGTYTEEIKITGAVRLLGANAGIDPNKKSDKENVAWTNVRSDLSKETVIRCTIDVNLKTGSNDLVLDGLTFGIGGAFADYHRNTGSSEITIKNTVFNTAGNEGTNYYALYLRSPNHSRTLNLQNLYITGQNNPGNAEGMTVGFICPFFTKLYADNIAYVENKVGFLAQTWFAAGVSPVVEVTNSCFYNANAGTPTGHIISMDNSLTGLGEKDVISKDVAQRATVTLKLVGNVFYNASASSSTTSATVKGGVIHFQFVNSGSVYNIENNYFYGPDGTTFVDNEFLINASMSDMSACMHVRNNCFIGAYKAPSMSGSYHTTHIDLSQNYFARTGGEIVNGIVYMENDNQRAIRTSFWADEKMTILNTEWDITTSDWSLAWVDNSTYNVEIFAYTDNGKNVTLPIKFMAKRKGLNVQLYKSATFDVDGIPASVREPISAIDTKLLNSDPYQATVLYLQVTDPKNPQFTPIYTLTISNCGDTKDMLDFSKEFPGHFVYHPTAAKVKNGSTIPYKWRNQVYLMEVGKNLFASASEAISYGYSKGYEVPTICIPSGTIVDEVVLPGSCTILGEQYGINPNVKPYDYLTQDQFEGSAWTLNPERSDMMRETVFNACIRVAEGADDYVITIDGIAMGKGCSYVDDSNRKADNVTIIKNVLALNAGGGSDRTGAANTALFNFNKAFGPVTDRCTFYMYDSRVDGLDAMNCFGAFYEKLVIDGCYFGHAINKSLFFNAMQSRDIADPYYSVTNNYFHKNDGEGQQKVYMISTNDHSGAIAAKTNIIYNFDGNVMNYGFQSNYGSTFRIYFTGTNMTFYFTNNTYRNGGSSAIILNNKTARFVGSCPQEDCSEIMVFKGNRIIENDRVPGTQGTGFGTMIDYSGNYWSKTVDGVGELPSEMNMLKPTDAPPEGFNYEECSRYKFDYNYLDWNLTVRSDEVLSTKSYLNLSKGMFNTGKVTQQPVNGKKMQVLTDKVAANVSSYDFPASAGEFDTIKYFSDAACTNQIQELSLTASVNEFYGMVYPYGYSAENTAGTIPFKIVVERLVGTDAKLLALEGGLVDQSAKTVSYEIPNTQKLLDTKKIAFEVSTGATYALYDNKACTSAASSAYLVNMGSAIPPLYLKVTSEDGKVSNVYTINVKTTVAGSCATAAVSNVVGMTDLGGSVYYAEVPMGSGAYTFTPKAYFGSKIAVRNGSKLLSSNADGSYTFDMGDAKNAELKLTATSQNGVNTRVYTLKFKAVANNEAKLYGIENATLNPIGYVMSLGLSKVVEKVNANVTPGASYKLYEDYECTKAVADGPIILSAASKVVYVKVTSANGVNTSVTRLTIASSAFHTNVVGFAGTTGNVEYKAQQINKTDFNLYLPAKATSVSLKSTFEKLESGAKVTFYADPYRKIEIDPTKIELNQRNTAIYFTIADTTYAAEIEMTPGATPVPQMVKLTGESGVINIISDRSSVTYSDASMIASWVKPYVDYMNNNKYGIFEGDANKKLNAASNITRNEIATVATRVMGLDVSKYANVQLTFSDTVDAWAQPYVKAAVGAGLINGDLDGATGKTYFRGSNNATREQVIKILVCICLAKDGVIEDPATYYTTHKNNVDIVYDTFKFEDEAKVSSWAAPYMHMAVGKYQMVNGSLNNDKLYLYPQNNITRAEVAKMVACYLGY